MSENRSDSQNRTHPKLVFTRLWASLVTGNMGLSAMCSFHNWFPDMQMFLWMEKTQQFNKRKDGRKRKFKGKAQKKTGNKN